MFDGLKNVSMKHRNTDFKPYSLSFKVLLDTK